jgi:hypothetical protein
MLANFLNKSKPINFITLLILFFVNFVASIYFAFFIDGFTTDKLLKSAGLLFLFVIIFFIHNFIITKSKLTADNSYAYFLLILFLIPILPSIIEYKTLLLAIIYLLFLRKIYSLRSEKNVLEKLFDSGFWLGVLCIQEPFFIVFLLLINIAAVLHKKINIHTLLVPIIGLVIPFFLYFTYFFWIDKTEEFMNLFILDLVFDVTVYTETKYFWLLTTLLLFTTLSAFIKSGKVLSINNTFRKSWVLMIANFIILIFFLLFLPQKNGSELIFLWFTVSIILTNGIELIKKKALKNGILYAFLVGSILFYFLL